MPSELKEKVAKEKTETLQFSEGNAGQSAEKDCIKLNTERNQLSESKETMLSEISSLLIVESCNQTVADTNTIAQRVKRNNEQENTCQILDNSNIHSIDKNNKLHKTADKCTKTSEIISCEQSGNITREVDNSSRNVEEGNIPREENLEKHLKNNKQSVIEHHNQNNAFEDKNVNQCLENQTKNEILVKKRSVAKVEEKIIQLVEETISQHVEKDKEIQETFSNENGGQFIEESNCKTSPENINIDELSIDKPIESTQETIATGNAIENSKETESPNKFNKKIYCKGSQENISIDEPLEDKPNKSTQETIATGNAIENSKETESLNSYEGHIKAVVEEMVSEDGPPFIPPLYIPENNPVWTSRIPPPPGCEPHPSTDFQLEYNVSQLPLTVRTYLVQKGITEGEVHEFSGAEVLYREFSSQSAKPHLFIQGKTQKQLNMATSVVLTLIKEGFEASMEEQPESEVGSDPVLEISNQAENNRQVQSVSHPTAVSKTHSQPVPGGSLPEHLEMEYEINDLPLTVRTHIVLKGVVDRRVTLATGAKVRTEGFYVAPQDRNKSRQKPLCVLIQAASEESLNLAIRTLDELKTEAFCLDGSSTIVRKVPVGLESAPMEFDLRNRLLGPNGEHLQYIKNETGAIVSLRGQRCGYSEFVNQESSEPLHIRLEHNKEDVIEQAQSLAFSLVKTVHDDFVEFSRGIIRDPNISPYPLNIATDQSGPPAFGRVAKVVYEGAPTSYGVPTKSPLPESKYPPRPQCSASAVRPGRHERVELPKKRQLPVEHKPSDQLSSKKPAVSPSSSLHSKKSLKKTQFTIKNATKQLPLQNTSALKTKEVLSVTNVNLEKKHHNSRTSCHTKEDEGKQPIWYPSPSPKAIKRRFSYQTTSTQHRSYQDLQGTYEAERRSSYHVERDARTQTTKDNKEVTRSDSVRLTDSEQNSSQNNEVTRVAELLQSALRVYVASLPAGLEATQLTHVQRLLQHVETDKRAAAEQRSQLRIVLQLLEKSLDNTGNESECKTPLLQTIKLMEKILHTKDNSTVDTEFQESSSQPCDLSENQKSLQLMQITELLQKALQSYVKKLYDTRQKSRLTLVLQVMQEVTAKISTVATNEQQNQLLTVMDLLENALQSTSSVGEQQPLQLLQIMQMLKKVLQKNAYRTSQVEAQAQSALTAKPHLACLPPHRPSNLVQLLQLMMIAMQTHINKVGVGPLKNQLLQIMQLLEYTLITQGKNLEMEEHKTQLFMILQLLETALQSSEQQPLQLLQIMQLIRTTLQAQASTAVAGSHPTQFDKVIQQLPQVITGGNRTEKELNNKQSIAAQEEYDPEVDDLPMTELCMGDLTPNQEDVMIKSKEESRIINTQKEPKQRLSRSQLRRKRIEEALAKGEKVLSKQERKLLWAAKYPNLAKTPNKAGTSGSQEVGRKQGECSNPQAQKTSGSSRDKSGKGGHEHLVNQAQEMKNRWKNFQENFMKAAKVSVFVPNTTEARTKNDVMLGLKNQNSINTEHWAVFNRQLNPKGQFLVIMIDETSLQKLKALAMRPYLGCERVTFKLLESKDSAN